MNFANLSNPTNHIFIFENNNCNCKTEQKLKLVGLVGFIILKSDPSKGAYTAGVDTAGADTAGADTATAQYGQRMKGGALQARRMCGCVGGMSKKDNETKPTNFNFVQSYNSKSSFSNIKKGWLDWIGWFKFTRHPTKGTYIAGVDIASADTATAQYGQRMKGGANGLAFDVQMCEMG